MNLQKMPGTGSKTFPDHQIILHKRKQFLGQYIYTFFLHCGIIFMNFRGNVLNCYKTKIWKQFSLILRFTLLWLILLLNDITTIVNLKSLKHLLQHPLHSTSLYGHSNHAQMIFFSSQHTRGSVYISKHPFHILPGCDRSKYWIRY